MTLGKKDIKVIIDSLEHTRHKFENYDYPSYEIKQERIAEINEVINKVKVLL
jgi:hypothetical protein